MTVQRVFSDPRRAWVGPQFNLGKHTTSLPYTSPSNSIWPYMRLASWQLRCILAHHNYNLMSHVKCATSPLYFRCLIYRKRISPSFWAPRTTSCTHGCMPAIRRHQFRWRVGQLPGAKLLRLHRILGYIMLVSL